MTKATAPAPEGVSAALDREFPEAWIPKEAGDELIGTFVRAERGSTSYGPTLVAIIAEPDGTERAVWLFYESMRSGFLRAQPTPGEQIGIRYLGKQPVKNQTPGRAAEYHNYKVAVDRPLGTEAPVDWAAELGTPAVDPDNDDVAPY